MSGESDANSLSDDQLIARLKHEAGPEKVQHDPFLDLPVAEQVTIPAEEAHPGEEPLCRAHGRRPLAVHGTMGAPVTVAVDCERSAGHEGPHRAEFSQTRILHHWHVFEWHDR